MSKYFLYRKQRGQGCDYTIRCGVDVRELHVSSMEEAVESAINLSKEDIEECWDEDMLHDMVMGSGLSNLDEMVHPVSDIRIYEVSSEIDLEPLLRCKEEQVSDQYQRIRQKENESSERQQYEKLKAKYG